MQLFNKLCVTTLLILALTSVPASANQGTHWVSSSDNWYLYNNDNLIQNTWFQENDGSWYHLDHNGIMQTGWFQDMDGSWYLLNSSGAMLTGWQNINGKHYYLDAGNGGRLTVDAVTPDGYHVDKNGAWNGGAKQNENSSQVNNLDAYRQEIFELVNKYRTENGVPPLTYSKQMEEVANIRAKNLFNLFAEDYTEYDTWYAFTAKENFSYGLKTPEEVMKSSMYISEHKENLLNPDFKNLGVGIYEINGSLCWVQNFALTSATNPG